MLTHRLFFILLTAGILLGCYEKKRNGADLMNKLDLELQNWYARQSKAISGTGQGDSIEVIIHTTAPEELKMIGVTVMTQASSFVTARVSFEQLKALLKLPSVRLVEKGSTNEPLK